MDNAFKYVRDNGIDSEVSYPYRGHVSNISLCNYKLSASYMDRMRPAVLNKMTLSPLVLVMSMSGKGMKLI